MFISCPRCFYLDRRLGIDRPPIYPMTLNITIDGLLKKEFDYYRSVGKRHPIMEKFGLNAIPFSHPNLNKWRDSLRHGIQYYHKKTNLIITGGVDDVWLSRDGELIIVDYKVVSNPDMAAYDPEWKKQCERQLEIYQWLFRKNGFRVKDVGYFLLCVCKKNKKIFNNILEFEMKIVPHKGDDSWIEQSIIEAHLCLNSTKIPSKGHKCDLCLYWEEVRKNIK